MVTTPGVWILRTRAQDPCSCCCRPGVGLRPAADHPQMVVVVVVVFFTLTDDAWVLDPADPGARSSQLLLQTWCGSAPRRGPSANGYDAWRFGSSGPVRKILAAAAADLVWVCAPPRTILKWLRRLVFWILRTHAQDPCSCCLIFRTKVDEKVDNSGWRIKIVANLWVYPPNCRTKVGARWSPSFPRQSLARRRARNIVQVHAHALNGSWECYHVVRIGLGAIWVDHGRRRSLHFTTPHLSEKGVGIPTFVHVPKKKNSYA